MVKTLFWLAIIATVITLLLGVVGFIFANLHVLNPTNFQDAYCDGRYCYGETSIERDLSGLYISAAFVVAIISGALWAIWGIANDDHTSRL